MQIVGKAKGLAAAAVQKRIVDLVRERVPKSMVGEVVLKPVFPGVDTGRRAGMFTVDLPDSVEPAIVTSIVDSLRSSGSVEYAELPASKGPL